MGKKKAALSVAMLMAATGVQADESLSCQVQQNLAAGAGAPKVTEFVWSTAHGGSDLTGAIRTSIGMIDQGEAVGSVTLDGQPVQLPSEARGVIRFGKVYDYGSRVVLAYRVEREWDATATPSEVVYVLNNTRIVADADILPGSELEAPGHCILVE